MLKVNPSSVALFFKIIQFKTYNYKTMKDFLFLKVLFKRQLTSFSTKPKPHFIIVLSIDNR